jgi:hypothetical protein
MKTILEIVQTELPPEQDMEVINTFLESQRCTTDYQSMSGRMPI